MDQILFSGIKLNDLLDRIGHLIDAKIGVLPTENPKSGFLSRKEVSELLRITLPTLHEWTKQGFLKSYKIGSRVLYKELEVFQALEQIPSFKHKKGGISHA